MKTLNALSLGYAGAIISAGTMLVMSLLAKAGLYTGATMHMAEWHMFFSLSLGGIIGGIIEAAVISFVLFYLFGLVYNWLVTRKGE